MDKLVIIDGNSLAYRAFYALPLLSNARGEYTNAVYGFFNILLKAISVEKPTHLVVTFDTGKPTFRHEMFADYKGTRKKMPEELGSQLPILHTILESMKVAVYSVDGLEADDLIGTIAKLTDVETVIITGDRDSLQLIDKSTTVALTKKGISNIVKMTEESLYEEMKLTPMQIVDLKALMGDASDNIPGVSGIGEKTALSLLEQYKTLEGVYENVESISGKLKEKLILGKESAFLSQQLATINTHCNIDFSLDKCVLAMPFPPATKALFETYQFKSLLAKPELFSAESEVVTSKTSTNKKPKQLTCTDELSEAVEECMQCKQFAFYFDKKITFANEKNSYVSSNEISMFASGLETEEVLLALKKVFESQKEFVCFGNKSHMHLLSKWDIAWPENVFDLQLALHLSSGGFTPPAPNVDCFFAEKKNAINALTSLNMNSLYTDVEFPLVSVLMEMEKHGCKVDETTLEKLSDMYEKTLASLTTEIHLLAGQEFNISSPKQVSEILFDKLHISTQFNKKRSTAMDILTEVQTEHLIVPMIIRYRKFFKLKTSFIDSLLAISNNNNGYVHTCFNQTLTSTGRLSSSDPNLQNIPTRDEEGKNIRAAFVSRFENGSITTADYNQIELRILAALSKDEHMVSAFVNNEDIHRSTAAKIFGIDPSSVTSKQRRDAKSVNFGVVYGISDYGLSQNIGCSVKDAKKFIDRYFEIYPKVKQFLDDLVAKARKDGFASTILNRRRSIPELQSSNRNLISFGERVAMNAPIQGSAADVIKIAMIKVAKSLKQAKLKSLLVLQIHDELLIDTYPGEEKEIERILIKDMENVVSLGVKLSVEVGNGKSWLDAK